MSGPKSLTANYNVAYTVTTVPEGLSVMVDGVTYTTPKTFGWAPGSVHWLYVLNRRRRRRVRRGRVMRIRAGATDKAQFHAVTMPQTSTTYTATFVKQYSLTMTSNPAVGGTVAPAGVSWWNVGATTSGVTATANAGYQFTDWTGSSVTPMVGAIPGVAIATLEMDAPKVLTAEFGKTLSYTVTSVPAGRQVVVDGSTYTTPKVINWLPGTDPYDRGDIASAEWDGDAICVSGLE